MHIDSATDEYEMILCPRSGVISKLGTDSTSSCTATNGLTVESRHIDVGVERDRGRDTKLVFLFLAKVQSSHRLMAQ